MTGPEASRENAAYRLLDQAEQVLRRAGDQLRAEIAERLRLEEELHQSHATFASLLERLGVTAGSMGLVGGPSLAADRDLLEYLRRSKDQLSSILRGIREGVMVTDHAGELVYANDATALALGYASADELLAAAPRALLERVDVTDEGGGRVEANDLLRHGTGGQGVTLRLRRRSTGAEVVAIIRTSPVNDERGLVRLWVSIFSDVTELKKTQEALLAEHRKGQQRLERIQEMAEGLFAIGLMPFAQATQQVAEVARRVTGADQAAFYPLDEAAQSFGPPIIAPAGARPFFTRNVDSLLGPVSSGVTRHSVHVPDTLADELWRDLAGTSLSLYATAVTFTDHHMGMLVLVSRGPGRVSEEERYLADTVAAYGGTILENARLYQQIGTLAAESERTRISHELHDGLAQVLGYVNTQAQAVEIYLEKGDVGEAREQLRSLSAAARRAYQDVRQGMMDIRASTRPGHTFKEALEEYLAYFHMRWGTQLQVTYDITPDVAALLPAQEVQVLRVVQEAMANARKHSRASSVVVRLARLDDRLRVEVIDNGTGFNPDAVPKGGLPRLGVTTMRERAIAVGGSLEIDSAPGRGTRVRLDVPLARTEATMEVRV